MIKEVFTLIIIIFFLINCGGKTVINSSENRSSKSPECAMEKEVCDDALDFQKEYDGLPEDQKKEMNAILNSYIHHCEEARKACNKSIKGK